MATANFYLRPSDGWVPITAAAVDFLRVSQEPRNAQVFIASGSQAPSTDSVSADGVITFTGQPANTGTVTVGDITYTFVTNFDDPGDYDVRIGANQAATEAALTAAINGRAAIPAVVAGGTVTISGGVPTADDTVTIGTEVYTFVALAAAPFEVTIGGDADATGANLVTTITADSEIVSGVNAAGVVTLSALTAGFAGNAIVLTEDADNTAVSGSGFLTGGQDEGPAIAANEKASAVDGAGIVTVTARESGLEGNFVQFSESATNVAVDGSGYLAGGVPPLRGVQINADDAFMVDVPEEDNFYVRTTTHTKQPVRVDVYYIAGA